jgi:uncharacterized protein YgiM (DUF1202 family)
MAEKKINIEQEIDAPEVLKEVPKKKERYGTVVGCKQLNVRTAPDAKASVLRVIDEGITYKVFSETKDWAKIGSDEFSGYVMKKYLEVK